MRTHPTKVFLTTIAVIDKFVGNQQLILQRTYSEKELYFKVICEKLPTLFLRDRGGGGGGGGDIKFTLNAVLVTNQIAGLNFFKLNLSSIFQLSSESIGDHPIDSPFGSD